MSYEKVLRAYEIWSAWYTTLDRVRAECYDLLDKDDQARIQHAVLAAPLGRVFPRPGVHAKAADALVARLSASPPLVQQDDWPPIKRAVMWAETEARRMNMRAQGFSHMPWNCKPLGDDIWPAEDTFSQPNWRPSFDGV